MHCRTARRRDEGIKLLDTRTCAVRMRSALVLTIPVAHGSFNLQLPRTLDRGVTMHAASPAPKQSMCEDLAGSGVGNHSVSQLLELEQGGPR